MAKTAILAIKIIGDATSATRSMDSAGASATSMSKTMDKAAVGAGLALGALATVATMAGQAASELQQATGAVDSVFGAYASKVHEYALTAAEDVGLSKEAYSNLSAVLGSQLKNMGLDMDAVGPQSAELISLGADLSAMFGGTAADAVGALSSLLRGERDPIERYGVSIKQVDIDARKAAMGLSDLTGDADKAATTQATLALLMDQTSAAAGQFARESDTASGQQQRATAAWENAQAALGEQLLPAMTAAAQEAAKMAEWAGENSEFVTILAVVIGVLAVAVLAITAGMKVYAAAQGVATAATWASNVAWLANPITWIVLAIIVAAGLLVSIIVLIIQYHDELGAKIAEVWQGFVDWISPATDAIGDFVGWLGDAWDWMQKLGGGGNFGWADGLADLNGSSMRMNMSVDPVPAMSSRMAITAVPMAAESRMATTATAPAASPGRFADASPAATTNVYNLTVNGAIDSDKTAGTIQDMLDRRRRRNGSLASGRRS